MQTTYGNWFPQDIAVQKGVCVVEVIPLSSAGSRKVVRF
ncbi:hypothetical protein RISK_005649 [Rhodopirellula islandica]|uniref:Uncharacterized protein n=1 Tax=Rhodopirellula islandica TaxID=595434 RepID=A0A0J1B7N7_RHOIS|nr:hypothetical protein RISK_005649 [Rhodopirellula islandica]